MSSVLERYPEYELNIGIEVHVQLKTKSKIFCQCSNEVSKEQNTNICEICAGYPGSLPVLNKDVLDKAILAGLATKCHISSFSTFARKHYFYPDLPKDYQTTQGERPICEEGKVQIKTDDGKKKEVRLIRIHMEEDAGKNTHAAGSDESFVDLNRAGTPLLEIVSYPDISSTNEAKEYLKAIHNIVKYIRVSTGNMEEGAFRADTNISVRKKGAKELGTRCELKNINSFKFIGDAIDHEVERQIELLEGGQKITQETRLWNEKNKETISMRSKEEAADYRYFQCPDLPTLEISPEWVERVRSNLPELPQQKLERFIQEGLSEYEAEIIVNDIELANYYEDAVKAYKSKNIINWILRDLLGYLKENKLSISEVKISPDKLSKVVELLETGKINNHAAKEVFEAVAKTGANPSDIVKEKGLEQIGSTEELEAIVVDIIQANPNQVEQYKAGKDKLFGFFVGQAMQKTKGKGNPKVLQELLKKHLS